MTALLVAGGRVVDPVMSLDAVRDVRIRDGIVAEIGEHLDPGEGETVLHVAGAVVAPGFIDMHVHLREPGFPQKETIATGTEAAVRGGFSGVACMPNTNPALDGPATLDWLAQSVQRSGRCRVYPIGAITVAREGREPCDFAALAGAGAVGFSDDGDTVADADVLRAAAHRVRAASPAFYLALRTRGSDRRPGSPHSGRERQGLAPRTPLHARGAGTRARSARRPAATLPAKRHLTISLLRLPMLARSVPPHALIRRCVRRQT